MHTDKPEISQTELLNAGYRYGWSLTSSKQDAEDLVHDAWIRLTKRYNEVPSKPLLYTTIRNIYIDQLRKHKRTLRYQEESVVELASNTSELERDFIHKDEIQVLMSKLRDVENEVLYLSLMEGYTAEEIASMTSSTRGSVLSLLHRSKQKLRQWLADEDRSVSNVVKLVSKGGKNGSVKK